MILFNIVMTMFIQSIVYDLPVTISNEETFLLKLISGLTQPCVVFRLQYKRANVMYHINHFNYFGNKFNKGKCLL